jgi:hypothetical protein
LHALPEDEYLVGVQAGERDDWAYYRPICYYPGTFSLHDAQWVRTSLSQAPPELVIRLPEEGTTELSVHVQESETEKPVSGARILVNRRDALDDRFTGHTDANGCFRTRLLTRGPFQVTAGAEEQGLARWSKWIDVAPDQKQVQVEFRLPKGAIFEGRVSTANGSELPSLTYFYCVLRPSIPKEIDGHAPRSSGWSCGWGNRPNFCYLSYNEGPQPEFVRVDQQGNIISPPVSPGDVSIQAELPDKEWSVVSVFAAGKELHKYSDYSCQPGERIKDLQIVLGTNLSVVAGRVLSAGDKTPMEGILVHLWRQDKQRFHAVPQETDRSGRFIFHSVLAGPYLLAMARSRDARVEESSKQKISVEANSVTETDLLL